MPVPMTLSLHLPCTIDDGCVEHRSPPAVTPPVLTRARDLTVPALQAAVDRLPPLLRSPARYHFGWEDGEGVPTVASPGGKMIRPALAVLSAEAAGAPAPIGVPGGAAVELIHNYSLIHDDIIDRDTERRHRATVWTVFGTDTAIIVGDALQTLAHQLLLVDHTEPNVAASALLHDATLAMIGGQILDMSFDDRTIVTHEECEQMEADKTGAILACASAIGAVLAGAPAPLVDALHTYGLHLGLAFQAVDDHLGIWGDTASTGKPVGNDLRERKKSVPVTYVLATGGTHADELAALFALDCLGDTEVARATRLIEAAGGGDYTLARAETHLDAALTALRAAPAAPAAAEELEALARFVCDRDH